MRNPLKKRESRKGSNRYMNYCKGKKVLPAIFGVTLILLAFGPILPQAQASSKVETYEMHIDKTVMEGWAIEGPVKYNGIMTTKITADVTTLENFIQYYEANIISSPNTEIKDLELYCTYVKGMAKVEGVMTSLEWTGDEEPPRELGVLPDPMVMTDAVMKIVYQHVDSIIFDEIDVAPAQTPYIMSMGSEMKSLSDLTLNSFSIDAGKTTMTLYVNPDDYPDVDPNDPKQLQKAALSELKQALKGKKALKQKDVTMHELTLVVPLEYSGGTVDMTIGVDLASIDFAAMTFSPTASQDLANEGYWEVPLPTLSSFGHPQAEWMFADGVALDGISLKTPSAFKGKPGTFEIFIERNIADGEDITVAGYSEIEGQHYMVVDANGVGGDLGITIPGADTEMVIKSSDIDVDYVQMWVFSVHSPDAYLESQEIKDDDVLMKGVNLNDLAIKLVYMHAEEVTLNDMTQGVT